MTINFHYKQSSFPLKHRNNKNVTNYQAKETLNLEFSTHLANIYMPVILLLTFEQPGKEKPPFLLPKQNSNDLNTAKILYYMYVVLSYFEQTCDL